VLTVAECEGVEAGIVGWLDEEEEEAGVAVGQGPAGTAGAGGGTGAGAAGSTGTAPGGRLAPLRACAIKCLNNRALCAAQQHQHKAVARDATAVLAAEPTNVKALIRRGLALEAQERFGEALRDMRAAVRVAPGGGAAAEAVERLRRGAGVNTAADGPPGAGGGGGGAGGAAAVGAGDAGGGAAGSGGGDSAPAPAPGGIEQLKAEGAAAFKRADYEEAARCYRAAAALCEQGGNSSATTTTGGGNSSTTTTATTTTSGGGGGGGAGGQVPGAHLLLANLSVSLLKLGRPSEALDAAR
jgi:tetratricopeptide (TPR) repeat protein